MMPQVAMFGYRIHALTMDEAVDAVAQWIGWRGASCRYVVTPNVHHTVMFQRDQRLRQAYASAGLVLADGMPIVLAARLLGRRLPGRVAGSDLVPALLDRLGAAGLRVYLLGAEPDVAQTAAANIRRRWPGVQVVGTCSPPPGFERDPAQNEAILAGIEAARPDVLVVGLGAPKQELWVHAQQARIRAPVALCVGATIDFLAGHRRRAPRWMQRAGLEWLYRLVLEPRRLVGRYACDAWYFPQLMWREFCAGRGRLTIEQGKGGHV
jgi:N-acetylglucosaminyldiphosphoundecaprenol N-acetyl-beta-D-mannosaminyltransferase